MKKLMKFYKKIVFYFSIFFLRLEYFQVPQCNSKSYLKYLLYMLCSPQTCQIEFLKS